jgi:hypothetical protein
MKATISAPTGALACGPSVNERAHDVGEVTLACGNYKIWVVRRVDDSQPEVLTFLVYQIVSQKI